MAFNCTVPLDQMPFENALAIAKALRQVVTVNRVIVFGGMGTTIDDLLAAQEIKENKYLGIHAARSKSYEQGYQCLHLGYGVNAEMQVPTILNKAGIKCTLLGKAADIIHNGNGKSVSCVDTKEVLELTIQEMEEMDEGFICTNVQQTDLAGHSQESHRYKELLEITDEKIGRILSKLQKEDILLIQADHGNDPNIGHNRHTRENVPLLVAKQGVYGVCLGTRKTLSDVGASVCDYFGVMPCENGNSFMKLLQKEEEK